MQNPEIRPSSDDQPADSWVRDEASSNIADT
jgi:hypothetical protein